MTDTPGVPDDPIDDRRTDEDRDISDVGLPGPGDGAATGEARTDDAADAVGGSDVDVDGGRVSEDAALDEVFPPESSG